MSRRLWFLHFLGEALVPARMAGLCEAMGFTDPQCPERRLICERFRGKKGGKSAEQCEDFYPQDLQRKHLPSLDARVRGWCEANVGFFTFTEMHSLVRYYDYMAGKLTISEQ